MIRIAKLTDYAIVLLTHFAREREGSVHTARDLVERSHLPLPTVRKLLKTLSQGGLLVSHRGAQGGYALAHRPEDISIAEVVSAVEGPIALTQCSAVAEDVCGLESFCPVRGNWRAINQVFHQALEGLSLADMAAPLSSGTSGQGSRRRGRTGRGRPELEFAGRERA